MLSSKSPLLLSMYKYSKFDVPCSFLCLSFVLCFVLFVVVAAIFYETLNILWYQNKTETKQKSSIQTLCHSSRGICCFVLHSIDKVIQYLITNNCTWTILFIFVFLDGWVVITWVKINFIFLKLYRIIFYLIKIRVLNYKN